MTKSYAARSKFSRILAEKAKRHFGTLEVITAEQDVINRSKTRDPAKRGWTAMTVRASDIAVIELARSRFQQATGKSLSKPEVMSALMAEGLHCLLNREDFGGDHTN
jgi:hypothetical protein